MMNTMKKRRKRILTVFLSVAMVVCCISLTGTPACALIEGYAFELEVDAPIEGVNKFRLEKQDIVTDKCGIGIRADNAGVDVTAGTVQATTIGVKEWLKNRSYGKLRVSKIMGDAYTKCALGADVESGTSEIQVGSVDVGMIREENEHRSAIDVSTGIDSEVSMTVSDEVNVTTEDTGAYISGIRSYANGSNTIKLEKPVTMMNGEYAVKMENSGEGTSTMDLDAVNATNVGKKGNYNYAAVNAINDGQDFNLNMGNLVCKGDTFVGLRARNTGSDSLLCNTTIEAKDISVESTDGMYGGYALDGSMETESGEMKLRTGDLSAPGYGVNFTADRGSRISLETGDITGAKRNVLKSSGSISAFFGNITSPEQGLNLSNYLRDNLEHTGYADAGYLSVQAKSITAKEAEAVCIDSLDSDMKIGLVVRGDMVSEKSDGIVLPGNGASNVVVGGTISAGKSIIRGSEFGYRSMDLTAWKLVNGTADGNANMFELSSGGGNYEDFADKVNYIVRAADGITVTKKNGDTLEEKHGYSVAHKGDKLYVSAEDMTSCQKLVNGTGAGQEDLQEDDNGYFFIVKAGGGIDFRIADNHDYRFKQFAWIGDDKTGYTAVQAAYECARISEHKTTEQVDVTETVSKATFTEDGFTRYTATVEAADSLDGQLHTEFKDAKAVSRVDTVKLAKTSYTYTGKAIQPAVTIADANGAFPPGNYSVKYAKNKNVGTATATVTLNGKNYTGTRNLTFKITKAANPLKIKAKTAVFKKSAKGRNGTLKKTEKLSVTKVIKFIKKGQGKVTYKKVGVTYTKAKSVKMSKKALKKYKKKAAKKITINAKTGKVTMKKGLKKGAYKVKAKVKAAGNANYNPSAWKTVTFKIKIK